MGEVQLRGMGGGGSVAERKCQGAAAFFTVLFSAIFPSP